MNIDKPNEYEGIPVFLRFSDIDRELSQQPKEKKAIEIAKAHGWRTALETLYDQGMVSYSTSKKRLKILDLLPLAKTATALEIGVGLGQHTGAIASRVKQLDTLEIRLVNAMFTKIRCEQERITNVRFFCGGDDCRLPFADNSYDFIFLNLVLEWCAGDNRNEPAPLCQHRLLSEIHRVLKPNGFLLLNTKNRFSYRLLTGGRDEHTYQMRFGSALPRWLLRLILRVQRKGSPAGYLHSYGALKRLICSAGLSPIKSYWAVPEMRFPEQFVPTDVKSIRVARQHLLRQGESRRTNILMRFTPARMVRYVTPGLFFIAQKA